MTRSCALWSVINTFVASAMCGMRVGTLLAASGAGFIFDVIYLVANALRHSEGYLEEIDSLHPSLQ